MQMLNEHIRMEEGPRKDWDPRRGMVKGLVLGLTAALVWAGLLGLVSYYLAPLVLNVFLRPLFGLIVGCTIIGAIQRGSGMTSAFCTIAGVVLTILVMLSNHVAFGMPGSVVADGIRQGGIWIEPDAIVGATFYAVIGIGASGWICHDGAPGVEAFFDMISPR